MTQTPRISPGFLISMMGLSELPFALIMMFLIDKYAPMEPIGSFSLGQLVAAIMILAGTGLFIYGRWLGWKPQAGSSGPVQRQ